MPGMLGRPFSFFPKRRPMEDLMLFFLAALLRESWLLLLLLGLLPWPSCRPARLSIQRGIRWTENKEEHQALRAI